MGPKGKYLNETQQKLVVGLVKQGIVDLVKQGECCRQIIWLNKENLIEKYKL